MLKLKLVSSQVKAFLDDSIDSFKILENLCVYFNCLH